MTYFDAKKSDRSCREMCFRTFRTPRRCSNDFSEPRKSFRGHEESQYSLQLDWMSKNMLKKAFFSVKICDFG